MNSTNARMGVRHLKYFAPGSLACALLVFAALAYGCQKPAPAQETVSTTPSVSARATSAQESLDGMDLRKPVPLLPMMAHHQKQNMRDHLVAVQEIIVAMSTNDYAGVERAASRIGFSEQMGRICSHMGASAPGFTDLALEFHRTADTIAEAARQKDRDAVVSALGRTLAKCTGCHAAFKQHVVDDAGWAAATKGQQLAPHQPNQ